MVEITRGATRTRSPVSSVALLEGRGSAQVMSLKIRQIMHVHPLKFLEATLVHDEVILFNLHDNVCVDVPRKKSPSLGTLKAIALNKYFFGLFLQKKTQIDAESVCMRRACPCRRHGHA